MGGKIKSSAIAAEAAINELVGYDTSDKQNQQVEFSYTSEIAGMEAERQACNQMLQEYIQIMIKLSLMIWNRINYPMKKFMVFN